jgi:hypothetical protein
MDKELLMKDFIVNSQEEFDKLLTEISWPNGNFINGNLVAKCNLKVNSPLLEVRGYIKTDGSIKANLSIKAGGFIKAAKSIIAGGSIKADLFIKAGGDIKAGLYIKADLYLFIKADLFIKVGGDIEAGGPIKAGGSIEVNGYIYSSTFDISCKHFKTKTLPFWRGYWAEMPPLQKWKKEILDYNYCWNDLRNLPTKSEKIEICGWEGWHWILKGHLECFFGLKDRIYLSK